MSNIRQRLLFLGVLLATQYFRVDCQRLFNNPDCGRVGRHPPAIGGQFPNEDFGPAHERLGDGLINQASDFVRSLSAFLCD